MLIPALHCAAAGEDTGHYLLLQELPLASNVKATALTARFVFCVSDAGHTS